MKRWRVFNISAQTPDQVSDKLEVLLTKLEEDEWEIKNINGPYPMAICEQSRDNGGFPRIAVNAVLTTFCAFVVAKQ